MVFLSIFFLLGFLLCPAEAFAWGAGVHLELGQQIINNLALLPRDVQALLQAFPHDFLYGCISADITIGKKFTHHLNHCHAWRMGKKILEAAEAEPQRACAYGYLAHLAADTIAHSYFVPVKMVRSFNTMLLKHTYWEIRLEAEVDPRTWTLAKTIAQENFRDNDQLMQSVLSNTIFSFRTNKRIFNSILLLSRLGQWQKMLKSLSNSSRWVLDREVKAEYFTLAGDAAIDLLRHMEASGVWQADPTGAKAIGVARALRKKMIQAWIDGTLSDSQAEAIVKKVKPLFRDAINSPDSLPDLVPHLLEEGWLPA